MTGEPKKRRLGYEEPPELTAEDEAILDRVHDQLGKERQKDKGGWKPVAPALPPKGDKK